MPVDTWLKENWGWLGGGAAALWGAYQWLRIEARNGATAAATREDEASERLWARLNTYVDDMEGVVKALRAENATLHEEIGAYRKRTVAAARREAGLTVQAPKPDATGADGRPAVSKGRIKAKADEMRG